MSELVELLNGDRIVTLGLLICCAGRALVSSVTDGIVKLRRPPAA